MSKADNACKHADEDLTSLISEVTLSSTSDSIFTKKKGDEQSTRRKLKSDLADTLSKDLPSAFEKVVPDLLNLGSKTPISCFSPDDTETRLNCGKLFAENRTSDGSDLNRLLYTKVVSEFVSVFQESVVSLDALATMYFDMEYFAQSEFSQYHEEKKKKWAVLKTLLSMFDKTLSLKEYAIIRHSNGGIQVLFKFPKTKSGREARQQRNLVDTRRKRVIIITDDFFLAHDGVEHETIVLVPGSPACLFRDSHVDLSSLFEFFPPSLIFFMGRRLYQFTEVQLSYHCFAKMEKNLMIAKGLIHWHFNLFDGVKIDLPPMLLSAFVGHKVGYMELLPTNFYGFGIDVLDEILLFERSDSGIASPVKLSEVGDLKNSAKQFEILPECTDYFDVCIGGRDHLKNRRKKLYLKQKSHAKPAYNLAYVPQFKTFYEKYDEQFSVRKLRDLEDTLKNDLNYGSHLSKAICKCLSDQDIGWRSKKKEFTLAEAQILLLSTWVSLSDLNSKPFPGWGHKSKERWSLVLHQDQLYLLKSKACRTRHMALGYGLLPMGMAVSSSEPDILNQGKVTNLYDAVMKISGTDQVLVKNIELDCYIPSTAESMQEILGAVVLVCTFMSNRVKAEGMFAGSASAPLTQKPQLVKFNIPIPLGVACSLISPASQLISTPNLSPSLREIMMLMPGSELKIDSSHNYCLPLILGGDQDNEDLRRALKQSVESGKPVYAGENCVNVTA